MIGHASSTDLVALGRPPRRAGARRLRRLGRPGAVDRLGRARRRRHLAALLHGAQRDARARRARPADRARRVRRPDALARVGDRRSSPPTRAGTARTTRPGASETWRDPFVFQADGRWHMLITARDPVAPRLQRRHPRPRHEHRHGHVGAAAAADHAGRLRPARGPAGAPRGRPAGCSSSPATPRSRARASSSRSATSAPGTCSPTRRSGRSTSPRAKPFTADPKLFAAPLVQTRDGEWVFIGFRNTEPEGVLNFHIIDPLPFALERR